jgi:hypothetical protein
MASLIQDYRYSKKKGEREIRNKTLKVDQDGVNYSNHNKCNFPYSFNFKKIKAASPN